MALQYGFFEDDAAYLVTSCIFIAPDSTEANDPASVTISLPSGFRIAAPWREVGAPGRFASTVKALVNNSIVIGKFAMVSSGGGNGRLSITIALLGKWPEHRGPETPSDRYLVTLSSGDEDGQAFMTSTSILTSLPVNTGDTEIWASTIAHELLHHWNGWLIRPGDPRLAFFQEGFTEYYANRQILAASLIDESRFWDMAALHLGRYSYFVYSPNYDTSIAAAGGNKTKNRFGVYDGGWTVALCLDLQLRASSHGKRSLDDVMRLIWQRYGRSGAAFTYEDFVGAVNEIAENEIAERDWSSFFTTLRRRARTIAVSRRPRADRNHGVRPAGQWKRVSPRENRDAGRTARAQRFYR